MPQILITILVTFFAGMGAGLGTGFAGMSAAAVISPMLITFLDMEPYMAVGIALSSDVLASAVSAYTYGKKQKSGRQKRSDHDAYRNAVYCGGKLAVQSGSLSSHGQLLRIYDLPAGSQIHCPSGDDHQGGYVQGIPRQAGGAKRAVRYPHRPDLRICWSRRRNDDDAANFDKRPGLRAEDCRRHQCIHHDLYRPNRGRLPFCIGGMPDLTVLVLCVVFTLLWARIAAKFANKASAKTLNRATGIVLVILGLAIFLFSQLS